ncbi:SDR family NAD(P)-dependent oxidoreductase [Vannielia litorea]|uniref:NADP-dependent 3-hydroxy acid dehydrogenase YdfG n=1 Tax=Vannielia litorea TaxID=1217970 RepID=A0A1N6FYA0_9RHOB|nr:SDR family oxidoreductase [Vannielia litorea]SIO00248.1 NADP-dependent 3-hydroxy acid dehydrogenase YdfG [Vannielia litorea]
MKDFKNKVVVITGGATGIGKAMADRFGAEGARVVIAARREERLQEAVAELNSRGVEARYKVCDVSDLGDMRALADFAWEVFGQVDVLVNNAGIAGAPAAVVDATPDAYRRVFDVNIFGMLNGIWAFGNRMIAQGTPAMILNVSSETGLYVPGPMMGGYSASKHAVRAISEALRLELPEHLQVGVIYPGIVQSELGGSPEMTSIGMPTDDFVNIIWPQIENGEFHIVSHPWAKDYAAENAAEIDRAFDRYAPHFEGDQKYDSKWLANQAFGRS